MNAIITISLTHLAQAQTGAQDLPLGEVVREVVLAAHVVLHVQRVLGREAQRVLRLHVVHPHVAATDAECRRVAVEHH